MSRLPNDETEPSTKLSKDDPVINTILELVPVSHWTFARFKGDGDEDHILSSTGDGDDLRKAKEEFALHRERVTVGPGIAATAGPLGSYSSGLTLVFADSRASFGILTLLRTAELGAFTSSEIRTLTFALDAVSEYFSELRLMGSAEHDGTDSRSARAPAPHLPHEAEDAAHYILNDDLEIVLAWTSENERRAGSAALQAHLDNRLPRLLEETVRRLTADWTDEPTTREPGVACPVPFLVVRTRPMAGAAGRFIGVSLERPRATRSLTRAAARFRISPREVQVLALLLDGLHLNEIAERLHITSSTVQDHIKSLLQRTGTENRSAMIAAILGWS